MYAIQSIKTGEFLYGTDFGYGPGPCRQRTSLEQMMTFRGLFDAKVEFIRRQCGNDYRIVRIKTPEVERVIDFDMPSGYDCDVREEALGKSF